MYIVFNGSREHRVRFTVKSDAAAAVYSLERLLGGDPRQWQWRAIYYEIPVAERLTPGRYALDLTIDGLAAGSYPFTVE